MNKKRINFTDILQASKGNIDCNARIVSDFFSIILTYLIVNYTLISANTLTLCSLVFGVGGTIGLYFNTVWIAVAGFYISYVLDFADGKVARLRKTASGNGKKLDMLADRVVFVFSIGGYGYFFSQNDMMLQLFQYLIFTAVFLLNDVIELSTVVGDYYNCVPPPQKRQTSVKVGYFEVFKNWKMWVPKRLFLLFFAFVIIPLTNFYFPLLILLNLMTIYWVLRSIWHLLVKSL